MFLKKAPFVVVVVVAWAAAATTKEVVQEEQKEQQKEQRFLWGTATAAYQVEGARSELGRQPSIWDAFDTPGTSEVIKASTPTDEPRVFENQSADVADDDFHRFQSTVAALKELNFRGARLSISWPRVATYDSEGKTFSVNDDGVAHYRKVLTAYKKHQIQVAVTMWHWDLPLALEERAARDGSESAWLATWLPEEFGKYATLLLSEFKDDVDYWITLNEPLTIVMNGYSSGGKHAPGRCSDRSTCYDGDDAVEPYVAAKTLILAHARAFRAWDQDFGRPGKGCGITLNADFCLAFDETSQDDRDAAERCMEWQTPLFFDPIFYGKWPDSIYDRVGPRMPKDWLFWSKDELDLVKGSHDGRHFFLNTYTTRFVRAVTSSPLGFASDPEGDVSGYNFTDGRPIGTPSSNGWLYNYGAGIRRNLQWHDQRYPGRSFLITENGWGNESQASLDDDLNDLERCNFYRDYVSNVSAAALEDQVDVAAYFAWSVLDNFEWNDGFQTRFGLVYVDYDTQLRTPKLSARYFQAYITNASSLRDTLVLPPCDTLLDHVLLQDELPFHQPLGTTWERRSRRGQDAPPG
mmetsp:Transcript_3347/g.11040  ORF Transcript_3347/g.11040 Transcript_3347/m.11040 type:complete len:578 (-) Transcript_3347:2078-3811(-)